MALVDDLATVLALAPPDAPTLGPRELPLHHVLASRAAVPIDEDVGPPAPDLADPWWQELASRAAFVAWRVAPDADDDVLQHLTAAALEAAFSWASGARPRRPTPQRAPGAGTARDVASAACASLAAQQLDAWADLMSESEPPSAANANPFRYAREVGLLRRAAARRPAAAARVPLSGAARRLDHPRRARVPTGPRLAEAKNNA